MERKMKTTSARQREADYAENMFENGHNRTQTNPAANEAPDYDRAAHSGEAETPLQNEKSNLGAPRDTTGERTDAAGIYDAEDGPIGGTEKELDDMESAATPVDRSVRTITRRI